MQHQRISQTSLKLQHVAAPIMSGSVYQWIMRFPTWYLLPSAVCDRSTMSLQISAHSKFNAKKSNFLIYGDNFRHENLFKCLIFVRSSTRTFFLRLSILRDWNNFNSNLLYSTTLCSAIKQTWFTFWSWVTTYGFPRKSNFSVGLGSAQNTKA